MLKCLLKLIILIINFSGRKIKIKKIFELRKNINNDVFSKFKYWYFLKSFYNCLRLNSISYEYLKTKFKNLEGWNYRI